ncbi:MAG: Translation initiation factor 3 subunit J component [Piccolia ochrophora]|nr:MAG: Translation initiation factor 3 subunit J component [Piccolia ochrophora]
MAPAQSRWDDEDESTPPSSPPAPAAIPRRSKFDDEEDDSDVLESWDAAEDSEAEAEKARQAAARKAQADAEAAANKKSKAQRRAERIAENAAKREAEGDSSNDEDEDEDETAKRLRLRATEQESDLKHAEDMFGNIGISNKRAPPKQVTPLDPNNPEKTIDLSTLPIFQPATREAFDRLRETLGPILVASSNKPQYSMFMQEFTKAICKELPSDQIKKVASGLTTLSNEKMREEKAAEKGGKKSKAAKTKTSLVANRDSGLKADTTAYDEDGLDE